MDDATDPAPRHPPIADPSSSSPPSKRRWSPCTWRYAIEEVQPELGSKPRNSHILSASSALSERQRAPDPPAKWASAESAGDGLPGGYGQISAGQISRKASWEKVRAPKNQRQELSEVVEERMRRAQKESPRERAVDASWSKRRKREMSPSELYFCEECAQRRSNGSGSSSPPGHYC